MATTYKELEQEIKNNPNLAPLADIIETIMDFGDNSLLDDETLPIVIDVVSKKLEGQENALVTSMINSFESNNFTRDQIILGTQAYANDLNAFVKKVEPEIKRKLLTAIFDKVIEVTNNAVDKYHSYNFTLPMTLEEGAQVPTYAHDTDAAADLYAAEDTTLPAHSISNLVRTGVHIELPENWVAIIVPRSSIGMKTGLRLSNSQGVIDSDYRGPLGVIYDNISDSDYKIKQGDRIAQMYVMPVYRFKAQVVDELNETERGEGAYGSTGK